MLEFLRYDAQLRDASIGEKCQVEIQFQRIVKRLGSFKESRAAARDGSRVHLRGLRDVLNVRRGVDGEVLQVVEVNLLMDFGVDASMRSVHEAGDFEFSRGSGGHSGRAEVRGIEVQVFAYRGIGRTGDVVGRDLAGDLF